MSVHAIRIRTLTASDAEALDRELAGIRAAGDPGLALDLSAVAFLTSVALSRFVALDRELKAAGGRLTLLNVRPDVRRVFAVSRLDALLGGCAA
ncbi:STAS domain-containing protein [Urbifossiella limnaea]|uniref:STAS domain protein n=1 Tax=Urbifossiella limnaea TaxID=2528023 RepID=A0A517XQ84_9BACT|nr:STAS domain-containing protein [Urbifossiella limnaea]QDU19664.1 STAS domain protein [Urbifossiella limnaea]